MTENIHGMTGFGSAEKGGFRVEVRSLNHRFLEISMKLPPSLMSHEMALRESIKGRFGRGKFDVYVSVQPAAGKTAFAVNSVRAGEVLHALESLKQELSLEDEIDLKLLLHWKDLLITEEVSYEPDALIESFHEALSGLEEMRLREGASIRTELLERTARIETLGGEVAALAPEAAKAAREKFAARLKEILPGGEVDEGRILQEAASLAERADVTEETNRIGRHVEHIRSLFAEGGQVGRKLDFLYQELIRETNTVASKSSEYRMLHNVIEMKSEIEKSREQAQNLQ